MGQIHLKTIGRDRANPCNTNKISYVDNLGKSILNIFFPEFCIGCNKPGFKICPSCKLNLQKTECDFPLCFTCENLSIDGKPHAVCMSKSKLDRFLFIYFYAGIARKILRLKGKSPSLLKLLLENISTPSLEVDLVIPIPSSFKYLNPRIIEPVDTISEHIANLLAKPILKALYKAALSKEQKKLNSYQRSNPAILVKRDAIPHIRGRRILLVDDICTTGSTLNTAAKLLKQFGSSEVSAFTLARDLRYNRA